MYPTHSEQPNDRTLRAQAALKKGALIGCVVGTLVHAGIGTGIGAGIGAAIGFYCGYRKQLVQAKGR